MVYEVTPTSHGEFKKSGKKRIQSKFHPMNTKTTFAGQLFSKLIDVIPVNKIHVVRIISHVHRFTN